MKYIPYVKLWFTKTFNDRYLTACMFLSVFRDLKLDTKQLESIMRKDLDNYINDAQKVEPDFNSRDTREYYKMYEEYVLRSYEWTF